MAKALKLAISILMANNVAVIAVCRGPIMDNMHIEQNAPSAVTFMEQMEQTCMKGVVPNVKRERLALGTGKIFSACLKIISSTDQSKSLLSSSPEFEDLTPFSL